MVVPNNKRYDIDALEDQSTCCANMNECCELNELIFGGNEAWRDTLRKEIFTGLRAPGGSTISRSDANLKTLMVVEISAAIGCWTEGSHGESFGSL
jgi:hypothetical protein